MSNKKVTVTLVVSDEVLKELTNSIDNGTVAQWISEELNSIDDTNIAIKEVCVDVTTIDEDEGIEEKI